MAPIRGPSRLRVRHTDVLKTPTRRALPHGRVIPRDEVGCPSPAPVVTAPTCQAGPVSQDEVHRVVVNAMGFG